MYIFFNPVTALIGLTIYIGISLLLTGVFLLTAALVSRNANENWGWGLAEGSIDILFGLVLLTNPSITAAVIPFIIGFWMMLFGVMIFASSFRAKRNGAQNWYISLIGGILTIGIGYLVASNLFIGAVAVTVWFGIGFLIAGLINVSVAMWLRQLD